MGERKFVQMVQVTSGFKLAQKFREKSLLPPGKIGRSFIGQEKSYKYRPGLVLNICSLECCNKYTSI